MQEKEEIPTIDKVIPAFTKEEKKELQEDAALQIRLHRREQRIRKAANKAVVSNCV